MKTIELRNSLNNLIKRGYGDRPVKVMKVIEGITYAEPVRGINAAEKYDGDLVWIFVDDVENPEWIDALSL